MKSVKYVLEKEPDIIGNEDMSHELWSVIRAKLWIGVDVNSGDVWRMTSDQLEDDSGYYESMEDR